MSLQNWLQKRHLIKHEATVAEIRSLLGVIDRELADSAVVGLSDEGRFTHAYDAGLLLCKLALHASGFELQKRIPGHHSYWINSLEFTIGKEQRETLIHLSKSSNLRHISLYDQSGMIQKQDADDLLEAARQLRADVIAWLHAQYPNLVPKGY
jgi:hypothetical protein